MEVSNSTIISMCLKYVVISTKKERYTYFFSGVEHPVEENQSFS